MMNNYKDLMEEKGKNEKKIFKPREINPYQESDFKVFDIKKQMAKLRNMSVAMYAKKRTGKSVLMKDLLSEIKDWYKDAYVFSKSAHLQPELFDYISENNVIQGFDPVIIKQLWDMQNSYIETEMNKRPKGSEPNEYKKKLDHMLLIFDDVIGDPRVRNTEVFNDLFILGRHINIAVFVLSQDVGGKFGLNAVCRKNLDLAIGFWLDGAYDRELFIKQYLSSENFATGDHVFKIITKETDYQAIIVTNFMTCKDMKACVYRYVASMDIRKFHIGPTIKQQMKYVTKYGLKFPGELSDDLFKNHGTRKKRELKDWEKVNV